MVHLHLWATCMKRQHPIMFMTDSCFPDIRTLFSVMSKQLIDTSALWGSLCGYVTFQIESFIIAYYQFTDYIDAYLRFLLHYLKEKKHPFSGLVNMCNWFLFQSVSTVVAPKFMNFLLFSQYQYSIQTECIHIHFYLVKLFLYPSFNEFTVYWWTSRPHPEIVRVLTVYQISWGPSCCKVAICN